MAARPNYYEVLGIPRNARPAEVTGAYNHWVAQFMKESTPPNPVREALLREACEVLSDPARRAAHDAELAVAPAPGKRSHRKEAKGGRNVVLAVCAVVVVAVASVGIILTMRPKPNAQPKARGVEDLRQSMAGSVSPIVTYDISGKASPAGLAWVIEDKVMVANCHRLPPGVQLMVSWGTKPVAARVTLADEALGLCKIIADGYVGEPLVVNATPPAVGATVYGAALGEKGDVALREAKVTQVLDAPNGKAIQSSLAVQPGSNGGPLLDAQGRVVAVATLQADGSMLNRVMPAGWLAGNRPRSEEPRPYQGGGAAASAAGPGGAAGAAPGTGYAPPLLSNDYGCDCDMENDPEMKARREERWKKISEMPPGEREKAERLERESEERVRKLMKDMNDRFRK